MVDGGVPCQVARTPRHVGLQARVAVAPGWAAAPQARSLNTRSWSTSASDGCPSTPALVRGCTVRETRAMSTVSVRDGTEDFEVTLLRPNAARSIVLFSVGSGGDPGRHFPLLKTLAESGCAVVAPHFQRLASSQPTPAELELRVRRLQLALDAVAPGGQAVAGVGHSIGASALLALAGGEIWLGPENRLQLPVIDRLDRLVLLAPATGFFLGPGALDAVNTPILAWSGTDDVITPPAQCEMLVRALGDRALVEVRSTPGAGHFAFMHSPPPHVEKSPLDHQRFLAELSAQVTDFVLRNANVSPEYPPRYESVPQGESPLEPAVR